MNNQKQKDLVSIIIPSYNYANYLDKRIESILNQTYNNIELIIIDDCSSDHSVEVLQKYASHPKVRLVLRKKNGGWISANNQGVSLVKGGFLLFAQCDDVCELNMIEKLVDAMHKQPSSGLAFCRSLLVDESGHVLGEDYDDRMPDFKLKCQNDALIQKNEMANFLLHSCVIPNLSAVLIRKECFQLAGDFPKDYPACADWIWFLRVVEHFDVVYVKEPLNQFMQHEETIRHLTKDKVLYEEYFRLLLSSQKKFSLSFLEHMKVQLRVMSLWSQYLIAPSFGGLRNFFYHFQKIMDLDPWSFLLFPLALVLRFFDLIVKIIKRIIG